MKSIQKFVLIYFGLLVASLIIIGCCDNNWRYIGTDRLVGTDGVLTDSYENGDTIRTAFDIEFHYAVERAGLDGGFGMIGSSYATSCPREYFNIMQNLSIVCDKEITVEGSAVAPGTNLLEVSGIASSQSGWSSEIRFRQEVIDSNKVEFTNGMNRFTASFDTDDGYETEETLDLYLDF